MNVLLLAIKDLRLQRGFLPLLVALEISGYAAYAVQMLSEIPGVAFGLLHGVALIGDFLICYRTMIAEEKNRALLFVKTLPVSTSEIIAAKFGVNLLLVCLNISVLLSLWAIAQATGWIHVRPVLTPALVISGLTLHCLNNAFFVAVSLIFTSERAAWVPFPAIFALMSVILNFGRIKQAFHLEPVVDVLRQHPSLILVLVWAGIAAMLATSRWAMCRRKVFA